MLSKGRKKTGNSIALTSDSTPHPTLLLGDEIPKERDEFAPSSPTTNPRGYSYPSPPQPNSVTPQDNSEDEEDKEDEDGKKGPRMIWTEEMLEQLVEVLYEVFERGGAAKGVLKKRGGWESHTRSKWRNSS